MSIVTEKDDPSLLGESNIAKKRPTKSRKKDPNRPRQSKPYNQRFRHGAGWPTIIWIGLIHLGALAAPFCFTWDGLIAAVFLYYLTGCVGVTLGLHRYLTHAGFKTYKPVRYALAFIGQLSGEGSALDWVATHRKHHAHSDQEDDPHSPEDGGWWAHIIWLAPHHTPAEKDELHMRWGPDLRKDRGMWFLHQTFILWHLVLGVALMGLGYYLGGWYTACSLVVWGMFLRLTVLLHVTWFVNSATHMWGYRNYETTDKSTNLWWVGLLAFGEGWHNNHHAYPRMAVHGHKWWEFDLTWNVLRVMRMCGLAWDIVDYKQKTKDGTVKV
ncbi:acyl-CoA desaturase [Bremerella cremea]|uniref:acyl-CoA desaturase n=1 Tax=Bremerella cremea TaxID=1031537 RepID=UPI0031EC5E4E